MSFLNRLVSTNKKGEFNPEMESKCIAVFVHLVLLIVSTTSIGAADIGELGNSEGQFEGEHQHSDSPSKSVFSGPIQLRKAVQRILLIGIRDKVFGILTSVANLFYRILNSQTQYSSLNDLTTTFRTLLNSDGVVAFERFFAIISTWAVTYEAVVTGIEHVIDRHEAKQEKKEYQEYAPNDEESDEDTGVEDNYIDYDPPGHRSDAKLASSEEDDDRGRKRYKRRSGAVAYY